MDLIKFGGYRIGNIHTKNDLNLFSDCFFFDSARISLLCFLKFKNFENVFIPNYYCPPVKIWLKKNLIDVKYYQIFSFDHFDIPDYRSNTLLLIVDYFGYSNIDKIISYALSKGWSSDNIIVDCSLSLFNINSFNSFYSPRKFLPIHCGGILKANNFVFPEIPCKSDISNRLILMNVENLNNDLGRVAYDANENEFSNLGVYSLREDQKETLVYFDFDHYKSIFDKHFSFLSSCFDTDYTYHLPGNAFLLRKDKYNSLKSDQSKNIFFPFYWSSVKPLNCFENELVNNTIFFPVYFDLSSSDIKQIFRIL